MKTQTLMIQGTTSDSGKSTLVTGLCRLLQRRGIRVAPFKPQNMALNSAVTVDGGEIGRAQAVQAQACGLKPHTDMNPVLLKPNSDSGSQIIIHGHVVDDMDARSYHAFKPTAMAAVLKSYQRLQQQYEVLLVEGAGSPAEINLRDKDIANMGFAEAVDCPVLLIADIERGGVFAHLVGTLELLSKSEQKRVVGLVINRFRGDRALLDPGINWLQQRINKPVVSVLPYLHDLHLEAEDSLSLNSHTKSQNHGLRVIVPRLPRLSNYTDFDPLKLHDQVELHFVGAGEVIPDADLIILPGSKNVRHDLAWLREQGWEKIIQRHLRYNGKLLGICGGYQMLGEMISDPDGIESEPGSSPGFALLSLKSTLTRKKQLRNVQGRLFLEDVAVSGYEIHVGVTAGAALSRPLLQIAGRNEGVISADGQIIGTYLHGLFESKTACDALLRWAGLSQPETIDYFVRRESDIDRLADVFEKHVDMPWLAALLGLSLAPQVSCK